MRASSEGHHETVEVLLADGADVNVKDKVSRAEGCEGAPMGARMPWTGCQDCLRRASAQTDCHPYDARAMHIHESHGREALHAPYFLLHTYITLTLAVTLKIALTHTFAHACFCLLLQ